MIFGNVFGLELICQPVLPGSSVWVVFSYLLLTFWQPARKFAKAKGIPQVILVNPIIGSSFLFLFYFALFFSSDFIFSIHSQTS